MVLYFFKFLRIKQFLHMQRQKQERRRFSREIINNHITWTDSSREELNEKIFFSFKEAGIELEKK